MLFYKDEQDFKKGIEENIEWNRKRIREIKKWDENLLGTIERSKELLKLVLDRDHKESIRNSIRMSQRSIKKSADTIKAHQGFIANSQEKYVDLCGHRYVDKNNNLLHWQKPGVEVAQVLSKEFKVCLSLKRGGMDQHARA